MTPRSPGLLPEHSSAVCSSRSHSTGRVSVPAQGRCALGRQPLRPPSSTRTLRGCGKRAPVIPDAGRELGTAAPWREVSAMSPSFSRPSSKTPLLAWHPSPSEVLP